MKKIKIMLLTIFMLVICSGCDIKTKDSMDDINVYTSLYPIQYVTEALYKDNAKIYNMYPAGSDPYKYTFTKKQIKDYSESDLVIYNGLGNEKKYIANMLNKNKNLKIIDATARIEYNYDMDEIWMNPSSVLTIAQNIKSGLNEYVESTYLQKEIETNYDKLKLKLSKLDADIKDDIENANSKIIIVNDDKFKILEKYNLVVYSLDKDSITDKTYNDIVKLFTAGTVKYIYTDGTDNEYVSKLKIAYPNIEIINLSTLNNISNEDKINEKDYITIMNENRDKIKKELYK